MTAFSTFCVVVVIYCNLIVCGCVGSIDNWAVIVSTSRYWFNYRHLANSLTIYNVVKSLGIPDSRIVFLNTLDIIENARNPRRGEMYSSETFSNSINQVNGQTEIDFSGDEVNVELFLRLLTGKISDSIPLSKRLSTSNTSNILIYMSGHGGDEFFKFHDAEELSALDLGDALREMYLKERYRSIMLVLETCQAVTMTKYLNDLPNIVTLSSSLKGENSYAYGSNAELGVAVVDRFTHSINEFFQKTFLTTKTEKQYCYALKKTSLSSLMNHLQPSFLYSTASVVQSSGGGVGTVRDPINIMLSEYFSDYSEQSMRCNTSSNKTSESNLLTVEVSTRRKEYLNDLVSEERKRRQ